MITDVCFCFDILEQAFEWLLVSSSGVDCFVGKTGQDILNLIWILTTLICMNSMSKNNRIFF